MHPGANMVDWKAQHPEAAPCCRLGPRNQSPLGFFVKSEQFFVWFIPVHLCRLSIAVTLLSTVVTMEMKSSPRTPLWVDCYHAASETALSCYRCTSCVNQQDKAFCLKAGLPYDSPMTDPASVCDSDLVLPGLALSRPPQNLGEPVWVLGSGHNSSWERQ